MDITARYGNPGRSAVTLPRIRVEDQDSSGQFNHYGRPVYNASSPTSARPMAIPNAREPVPPALPPPRFLPDLANGGPDLGWRSANERELQSRRGVSPPRVHPGSSLFGGYRSPPPTVRDDWSAFSRDRAPQMVTSPPVIKSEPLSRCDEEPPRRPGASTDSRSNPLPTQMRRFQSSIHDQFQSSTQAYDKSLLQKFDTRLPDDPSPPPNQPVSLPSGLDAPPISHLKFEGSIKPRSLPIITSRPDSSGSTSATWSEAPTSAISPRNINGFKTGPFDHVSPSDSADSDRSPRTIGYRSGSSATIFGDELSGAVRSYDRSIVEHKADLGMGEEARMGTLRLEDRSSRAEIPSGAPSRPKRRASSPIREDRPPLNSVRSASDLQRRRESAPRYSPIPPHLSRGSISAASGAYSSIPSIFDTAPNSFAASSYGMSFTPGSGDAGLDQYSNPLSLPSPRGTGHQRAISETRLINVAQNIAESSLVPSSPQIYVCECCPKKPKRFDNQADLILHEGERQYTCQFCPNRFKNKNEAERHQSSLHVRNKCWSCAALSDCKAAFHPSAARPNEADTCGYCGEDFVRSGLALAPGSASNTRHATEQDWAIRIQHLQEVHKFKECNQKPFFRADHFRQHLKHSHAGTSGKWTNMLENACMRDHDPSAAGRDRSHGSIGSQDGLQRRIPEENQS